MNELACLILDWKRPQNMEAVIAGVLSQSIDVNLYIVHQENDRVYPGAENIHIQTNRGCGSRWNALPFVESKYTVFLDDDLQLTDPQIFETMLSYVKTLDHVSAVGALLGDHADKPYTSGNKVYAPIEPTEVDICLGNLNMVKTEMAIRVWCTQLDFIRTMRRPGTMIIGDDDIISSFLFTQSGFSNYVVGNDVIPYQTLSTLHGLENDPDHYNFRNSLCIRLPFKSTRT